MMRKKKIKLNYKINFFDKIKEVYFEMGLLYKSEFTKIPFKPLTDKCIVLDLDETLIHSNENINDLESSGILDQPGLLDLRKRIYSMQLDDVIDKKGKGVKTEIWGISRPHVKEFLIMCFSYFKIVAVWSAGQRKYVEAIVDYLFRDIPRPHVIFTYDDCQQTENNLLVKPLQKMFTTVPGLSKYMSLENTFVIDDRASTFTSVNPANGILIPAYKPTFDINALLTNDNALQKLSAWFMRPEVINCIDVKLLNKKNIFFI
jgi:TFIIF-interacting CTD phosphatase-like protein